MWGSFWSNQYIQLFLSHILGGSGSWSTEGCRMDESVNGHYRCRCNHMTHFGVLLHVPAGKANLSEMQRHSLSIVTYVGCGISFVCLLLTFGTFAVFRWDFKGLDVLKSSDNYSKNSIWDFGIFKSLRFFKGCWDCSEIFRLCSVPRLFEILSFLILRNFAKILKAFSGFIWLLKFST